MKIKKAINKLDNSIMEYDENGNLIHYKNSNGFEEWYEYDENGNIIHIKDSDGFEFGKNMMRMEKQ